MKIIFFSYHNSIAPVAQKLIAKGNEVVFAQIEDIKDISTDEEIKKGIEKEEPELKKRRLSLFDGIFKKYPAKKVAKSLSKIKDKNEWFVMSDSNHAFRYLEYAQQLGFPNGLFATQEDRMYEVNRDLGKEIVEKHYPGLNLKDYKTFKTIEEGIKFLEDNENIYVLKSLGDRGDTEVPKTEDAKIANQQLVDILKKNKVDYEANGFLLEQKIIGGYEFTPQAVFYDGKLVYTSLDIETKTIGSEERGQPKGCGTNLIIRTEPEDKINKLAFPPYIHQIAKKRKGLFVIDAAIIFDKDKPYFLEFCYQRMGWDSFPTELAMSGNPMNYFKKVMELENPLKFKFGVAIRLFNLEKDKNRYSKEDLPIDYPKDNVNNIWLYDVKKVEDKEVSIGVDQDLGVATDVSDNLDDAINGCFEIAKSIVFKNVYFRGIDDLMSISYPQSILSRLKYAIDKGLIKKDGIIINEDENNENNN